MMIDFEKTIGLNMFCPVCGKKIQNVTLSIEGEGPNHQEITGTCRPCGIYVKVHEWRHEDLLKNIDIRDRWNKIFRSEFKTITLEDIENAAATYCNGLGTSSVDGLYISTNEILSADAQKYCEEHNIRVIKENDENW